MPTVPDIHRRGTRAAQATIASPPLTVGTLYFVTDEGVTERWNGTAWEAYSGAGGGGGAPAAHAPTHKSGGSDPIALDTLAAPTDITTLNATASAHGLLRKLSGSATDVLSGVGTWVPAGGAPSAHATTHNTGGSDPITALAGSVITTGTVAAARLGAHAASHKSGGADAIALDTLAAPTDITTLNATTGAHGLLPKLSGTVSQFLTGTGTWAVPAGGATRTGALGLVVDGAGSVLTTGVKGFLEVPYACTITAATLLSTDAAATAGAIVIDIWKDTYANYPPTAGDSITASAKPTLSAANKSRDTTLTGWTTTIAAGDVLGFSVLSVTTLTRVLLTLTVQAP